MGKYRVETDSGVYEVETDDAPSQQAPSSGSSIRAMTPSESQKGREKEAQKEKADEPWEQAKEWGTNIVKDLLKVVDPSIDPIKNPQRVPAALAVLDRLYRPASNLARRYVDPTAALGGSVLNLERHRPMEHDEMAAGLTDFITGLVGLRAPTAEAAIESVLPKTAPRAGMRVNLLGDAAKEAAPTYQEAKSILERTPSIKSAFKEEARSATAALKAKQALETHQALRTETAPTRELLKEARTAKKELTREVGARTSALSAEEEAGKAALEEGKATALTQAEHRSQVAAEEYQKSLPSRAEPADVKTASMKDVTKNKEAHQKKISDTHGEIVKLARDSRNTQPRMIQKAIPGSDVRMVDEFGNPVSTGPKMQTVEQVMESPANISDIKADFQQEYKSAKHLIDNALSDGSPSARALIKIMEGKNEYEFTELLEDRAALHAIGNYAKDANRAAITKSDAIARKLAGKISAKLTETAKKLPHKGEELAELLDREKGLLEERRATYGTPEAISTARSIARHGQAAKFDSDPIGLSAWKGQVNESTFNAAKNQRLHDMLAGGQKQFSQQWSKLNPDVKKTWFSEADIAAGDRLASMKKADVAKITSEFEARDKARISKLAEESESIQKQKSVVAELDDKISALREKFKGVKEESPALAELQKKHDIEARKLRIKIEDKRFKIAEQERAALKKTQKVEKYTQHAKWAAAGALGASAGARVFQAVRDMFSK